MFLEETRRAQAVLAILGTGVLAPRETYARVGVCALPASKPISIPRGTVSI